MCSASKLKLSKKNGETVLKLLLVQKVGAGANQKVSPTAPVKKASAPLYSFRLADCLTLSYFLIPSFSHLFPVEVVCAMC